MDKQKYHALLRGVLEQPADDNARLVFADFLSDEGREEHGEFIRLQVELARGTFACSTWMFSCGELSNDYAAMAAHGCTVCKRYAGLKLREKELLGANQDEWAPAGARVYTSEATVVPEQENYAVRFQRGFIDYLWVAHRKFFASSANRLFSWHPVTYVRLVDRVAPTWSGAADIPTGAAWWFRDFGPVRNSFASNAVHPDLFRHLTDYVTHRNAPDDARFYDSPAAAYAALSRACVRYGRAQNDLPDVDPAQFYDPNP
jgi:uncharacterized protein (TIGR02996 family)